MSSPLLGCKRLVSRVRSHSNSLLPQNSAHGLVHSDYSMIFLKGKSWVLDIVIKDEKHPTSAVASTIFTRIITQGRMEGNQGVWIKPKCTLLLKLQITHLCLLKSENVQLEATTEKVSLTLPHCPCSLRIWLGLWFGRDDRSIHWIKSHCFLSTVLKYFKGHDISLGLAIWVKIY